MTESKITSGNRNLITDIGGIQVGNSENMELMTGVTYIKLSKKFKASLEVIGGAPASREIELLRPENTVEFIDGIVLSGGSVYGLAAASEIVDILHIEQRGYKIRNSNISIPIVPCAAIYDLSEEISQNISSKIYTKLANQAYHNASRDFGLGNYGAGYGARAGSIKGGQGSASIMMSDGSIIGALTIVNSFGSTVIPGTNILYSSIYERENELGGNIRKYYKNLEKYNADNNIFDTSINGNQKQAGKNTTISVIATNIELSKLNLSKIAKMSISGLSRAIRPVGTPLDGDLTFVISSCEKKLEVSDHFLTTIGSLSSDTLTRSIGRAIYNAETNNGIVGYSDIIK
ncbi:MAG: P1 family peptidase [Hyphomicrobiales bacterium]|jgi:L-aminopeptidase/D-esterase-like protein|nr:P1 family peptidase [Hyphomicrobiales bacterium]|tara:strand:- start:195 stop:1232 length:1038 start_codon:yes stop_codon:yes gene_type:complete